MMKSFAKKLALAASGLILSSQALANQFLTLDYRDAVTYGNGVYAIKQDLQRVYPRLRLQDLDLISVQVMAKSRDGYADANVRVGGWFSERRSIYGNPYDWNNPGQHTYSHLQFHTYGAQSQGPWQLHVNGNVKVRSIVVEVMDRYRPVPPRPVPPRPIPPRPRPPGPFPPNGRYVELECASQDYNRTACRAGFPIARVVLLQQHSTGRGQCVAGRSFYTEGDLVVVTEGCRGRFGAYGY